MKKFTPYYTVSYQGQFHRCGEQFKIDDGDVEMMRKHGKVEEEPHEAGEEPPRRRKTR